MATAADAGNKAAANAALARVTRAAANRSALVGIPANAGLGAIVAKAKANASRAVQVAKQMKNAANAAAKARREAEAAAAKAARAAAARAAADAKAAAAAQAAETARTAAAAEAARKAQEAANKQARNAIAAQAKAEANAAKAAANAAKAQQDAEKKKVREFVLKLWPLTKGNFLDGEWKARLNEPTFIKQQISKFNPGLTVSQRNAIIANIIQAEKNKKIGHWGLYGVGGQNKNLRQRLGRAQELVNLAFPPPSAQKAAAAKIVARWKGRKVRGAFINAATEASKAAIAARAAAAIPGGATKSRQLAKQMRLARIAQNLSEKFINSTGQLNNPSNFTNINKTLLQGLTEDEIVDYLKTVEGFKPGNTRSFTNNNLKTMARYFTAVP